MIKALAQANIEAFAVAVTHTVNLTDGRLIPELGRFNWLAFTSANGAACFFGALRKSNLDLPDNVKIAAVGSATSQTIEKEMRVPDLVAVDGTGVGLAEEILASEKNTENCRILWPCAENALNHFPEKLKSAGVAVDRWIAYRTEPLGADIIRANLKKIEPWQVAVFAAPSAVEAFLTAWGCNWDFASVAIGPTTAEALRKAGCPDVVMSKGTSGHKVAETIIGIFPARSC